MLKCLPLPVTKRAVLYCVHLSTKLGTGQGKYLAVYEHDLENRMGFLFLLFFPLCFVLIIVCLFQDLYRCDILDFGTEQNCEANANARSKASWGKQKSFIWLWWPWGRSAVYVSKVVCVSLGVCWGKEEGDICTATYPDFEMFALCNWLRGVFKLPNLGVETTVAFRLKREKLKLPNLWGGQAPHIPLKRLNLYNYMKQLLSSQYILQSSWTCF